MKKMRLDPDALSVESFDTSSGAEGARGTVRGHDTVEPAVSDARTCLCPRTSICIPTVDYPTCVVTACNDVTCTCQPPTQFEPTCADPTCGLTYCRDTCDYCLSFTTDAPQRC